MMNCAAMMGGSWLMIGMGALWLLAVIHLILPIAAAIEYLKS